MTPAFAIVTAMLVLAALLGGASRADALSQGVVRAGEAVLLALLVLVARPVEWRSLRLPLAFMGMVALLAGAMLVPLPPSWWTALPGRGLIAQAAPLAGMAQPWRPFAMTPPLGWNAFFALIPPAAVLIGLVYLAPLERVRLVWPMAALIVLSALLGLAQLGAGPESALRWYANQSRDAGVGFFANRNHQALFLAAGFPVLALWAAGGATRWPEPRVRVAAAIVAAVLLGLSLLSTGSRAGLLVGAIAVVASGAMLAGVIPAATARLPRRARLPLAAGGAALVAAVVAVGLLSPQARSVSRLFSLDVAQDLRATALPTLRRLLGIYLPAGTGLGGFERAFRAAEPFSMLKRTYFNAAHNDYLQVLIEAGVAGALLLIVFVGWWLSRVGLLWHRRGAGDPMHRRAVAAGLSIVLLVLVASGFDYPVRTPLVMVMLVVACGWAALPVDVPGAPLYDERPGAYSDNE